MHVFRYDPAKRNLFLQYPNGTLYSHGSYPDGIGMMLFWNYSNPAAADYVVDSILSTVNNSDVDGTFTDDSAYVRQFDMILAILAKMFWGSGRGRGGAVHR